MKRLMSRLATSALLSFKQKRLMRCAEWVDVSVSDPNLVQDITNIMASGGQMQILYNNEWKLINPYGWNTSKDGNILLMCYKDTGEVRSYRFDRIEEAQLNSSDVSGDEFATDNSNSDMFNVPDDENDSIPSSNNELPFEDELDILDDVDDENKNNNNNDEPEFKPMKNNPEVSDDNKTNDEGENQEIEEDNQQTAV